MRLTAPLVDMTALSAPPPRGVFFVDGHAIAAATFWSGFNYTPPPSGGWITVLAPGSLSGVANDNDSSFACRLIADPDVTMALPLAPPIEQFDSVPIRGAVTDGFAFGGAGPPAFAPHIFNGTLLAGRPSAFPRVFIAGGRAFQHWSDDVNTIFAWTYLIEEPIEGGGR